MTIDRNQPKRRTQSLDLTKKKTEEETSNNLPRFRKIATASTEQLTREPIDVYPLASGGHARIFLAKYLSQEYIIKKGITRKDQADLQKEKEVLQELADSLHVVDLMPEGINLFENSQAHKENALQIYEDQTITDNNSLVLKKIEGEQLNLVFQKLESSLAAGVLDIKGYLNVLIFLFKDILLGLQDIQQKGFIHGDLKPNNILYDKAIKKAVVIDFGTTVRQKENVTPGHEAYASPETLSGMLGQEVSASFNDDLWSVGQIIYEVLNSLFHNKEFKFLLNYVSNQASYSDRIGQIAGLIAVHKSYLEGQSIAHPQDSNSSRTSQENEPLATALYPSDIYTHEIVDSPINHIFHDFETFDFFHEQMSPLFYCLEGIFARKKEQRISVSQALEIFHDVYNVDIEQATEHLENLRESIELDAERMKKAREKYQ